MVIDSGAASSFLSTSAARRISGLGRAPVLMAGIFGQPRDTSYVTRPLRLAFAGLSQSGRFLTLDLSAQSSLQGTEIGGLIGVDTLRVADMTIDYTNGLVLIRHENR